MRVGASPPDDEHAARLRDELTARLLETGAIRSAAVRDAFLATPRHVFVPDVPVPQAYADTVVPIKFDAEGRSISALSQPTMVALMLEQLDVAPGDRVLELGAGTGYNAALLGHLAGSARGRVVTVDVDADLVEGASGNLSASGARNVEVVLGDGALGYAPGAPYDRITATVGAADVPPQWLAQLAPGGRLLVPLRLRGVVTLSLALEQREDGLWHSVSAVVCLFMPLRGIADDADHVISLTPDADVRLQLHHEHEALVDTVALGDALSEPASEIATGVGLAYPESPSPLGVYLACALPGGVCRLTAADEAIEKGLLANPLAEFGTVAAVDGGSLAYLSLLRYEGGERLGRPWEIVVVGHGPGGSELASTLAAHVRDWDRDARGKNPAFRLAQSGARDGLTGRFVLDKPHSRIAVDWV